MYKYFNSLVICNELDKRNKEQEIMIKELQKQLNELQYKYEGLEMCKREIYNKYQNSIVKSQNN